MKRRRWTHAEIVTLLSRYAGEGPIRLAEELSRTEDSVNGLARRLGQRTPRRPYRRSVRQKAIAQ